MKRNLFMVVTLIVLFSFSLSLPYAHAQSEGNPSNMEVPKLTDEQMAQLNTIRQAILSKQIELVNKYVEFGVLTREKGNALIKDLKKREGKWQKEEMTPSENPKSKSVQPTKDLDKQK